MQKESDLPEILFVGTYPPRECGIATFTRDLTGAIDRRFLPTLRTKILAMNNNGVNIYNYQKKVIMQVSDTDISDYIEAAKKVNQMDSIKLVVIQHEFGIFGGVNGDNLLAFLELLEKPCIITFHSVLPVPNFHLKKVVQEIAERVSAIVVMTRSGITILRKEYDIKTPIYVIPHGIPKVNLESQDIQKKELGFQNKIILSSFGMLSSGKGYEYVIESLPKVVKKYPNLMYLIVGETHPVVRKKEGEKYRNFLDQKIKKLGLNKHVKFYNKYVTLQEIIQYLKATDIYISSGLNPNQITSGTLAYAMGCGRAVISTPFIHAKDAITKETGCLARFSDPSSFTKAILKILGDENKRKEMEIKAYYATRPMTWANVAFEYGKLFQEFIHLPEDKIKELPKVSPSHLMNLTDNFGIIQFASQNRPDIESGYTLDDNARALIVAGQLYQQFKEYKQLRLLKTYLDYIKYVQADDGKLYNYVDKTRSVNKSEWIKDAHGRALWSLGYISALDSIPQDLKREAKDVFLKAFPSASLIDSPRAIAFAIIGMYYYNKENSSKDNVCNIKKLADKLVELYNHNAGTEWKWFEDMLSYSNSKIPEALLCAYASSRDKAYLQVAKETLDFLISKTFENDIFIPIGQRGWYKKDGTRAYYDQQPVDVAYMVQTLLLAHQLTRDERYKNLAIDAFQWFLGKNTLKQVVYDETTGGCHDGVGEGAVNLNQGAESTLSYLMARLSLAEL